MTADASDERGGDGPVPLPPLEVLCDACDGSRVSCYVPCPICHASGYAPTEFGERVLRLVRHNFAALMRGDYE